MYDGKVNIFQDDLDRFLEVAQRFKLEGLLGDPQQAEETYGELEEELEKPNEKQYSVPLRKEKCVNRQNLSNDNQLAKVGNDDLKISMSQEDKQNLDSKVNQYVERSEDGLFYCTVCRQSAKQKIHVKNHVEAKHLEGIEIPCPICGKIFRSRHNLSTHTQNTHKLK